jgi:hypothetical protein
MVLVMIAMTVASALAISGIPPERFRGLAAQERHSR